MKIKETLFPETEVDNKYHISNFNFSLPASFIAQKPPLLRDLSRLLVVDRRKQTIEETVFKDIGYFLKEGDILVLNNTRVIKTRFFGKIKERKVEIFLLREQEPGLWEVLARPAKKVKIADEIIFAEGKIKGSIINYLGQGVRLLKFSPPLRRDELSAWGEVPTPPYIKEELKEEQYQTVYATYPGAVAAPTAGLHFTKELLNNLKNKGVNFVYITLHCGLATFRPIKCEDIREHKLSPEWAEVSSLAAETITKGKKNNQRIIAVGTTSCKVLEALSVGKTLKPYKGLLDFYIYPGYNFKMVDALITNFHTPCSPNLVMVSAFCPFSLLKKAYNYAFLKGFRFYSLGDAMLVI